MKIKGNFRAMFHRFAHGKAKSYKDGDWRVAVGGYDLWFEVYLKDEWLIRCVNGELDWRNDILSPISTTQQEVGTKPQYKCIDTRTQQTT